MSRACTVCTHSDRRTIDAALARGDVMRQLAALNRVSEDALARHKTDHLPVALVKAQEQEDVRNAIDVVQQLKAINGATLAILHEARQQRDPDTALKAIDRIQRQIELQAKLLGDLDERPVVNVLISPEWLELRTVIVGALEPHPEARDAVVRALEG